MELLLDYARKVPETNERRTRWGMFPPERAQRYPGLVRSKLWKAGNAVSMSQSETENY